MIRSLGKQQAKPIQSFQCRTQEVYDRRKNVSYEKHLLPIVLESSESFSSDKNLVEKGDRI